MQLKHFSNRSCEKAAHAGAVNTLCIHCQPTGSFSDYMRGRMAGPMPRGACVLHPEREGVKTQARSAWSRVGWASRPPTPSSRRGHRASDRRRMAKNTVSGAICLAAGETLYEPLRVLQTCVRHPLARVRNAAMLPETTLIPLRPFCIDVQNSHPPSGERRQNFAILPESPRFTQRLCCIMCKTRFRSPANAGEARQSFPRLKRVARRRCCIMCKTRFRSPAPPPKRDNPSRNCGKLL